MNRIFRHVSIGALPLLLTGTVVWAQATAQLNGRVSDPSGAVLPGVTVTMTQTDTGISRSTITDQSGSYLLSNLPTGPYRLEVTLQGFRTYVQTGIVLQVEATPTINAVLQLGDLAETVTVEGATPLVDVRSAGIKDVVNQEQIVELPLQGRQVTDLIILAGAAVQSGTAAAGGQRGVAIGVAGGLSYGVTYLLDGAMHNDTYSNLNLPLPFPDALQEFSVATSGLSAQNGMHSGASVNAATKSGTNSFHGVLFEFLRHHRFNAISPFAAVGQDGKRKDDGLKRNQFGGTIGGPIVQNKLFFFGAYQGTPVRQTPADLQAFVPTAAMKAGDFTAFASPACNGGRQIALRAPFVNNQISPALFSPAAVYIASRLPAADDPCGKITYSQPTDSNESQGVGKIDFQLTANHSVFGRYLGTKHDDLPAWPTSGNVLTVNPAGRYSMAHSLTFGDTVVLGANMVNSLRFAFNRTRNRTDPAPFFDTTDAGIKVYTYVPGAIALTVSNAFTLSGGFNTRSRFDSDAYQVAEDLTFVRGRHQLSIGANVAYWNSYQEINARSIGLFQFNGGASGLALADFLTGQLFRLEHGAPGILPMNQTYLGLYGQDAWRWTDRVTVNAGVRWEPFLGAAVTNGAISNFNLDNFKNGVKSKVFVNAPAGLIYPGDAGFPESKSGLNTQWRNLSPRVGLAWDVSGDGKMAIRASYGVAYDFPTAAYQYINASAAPYANRLRLEFPAGGFDNPYRDIPGGDTHPLPPTPPATAPFPSFGSFGAIDPDINSPRVQSWNVTLERQLGSDWQASASYLGNYSDRLWNQVAINPGQFLGLGPCTIVGVSYPVCTSGANLDQRRVLYAQNPKEAQFLGPVDLNTDLGTAEYRGVKLSFRRRAVNGVSLSGNYTRSYCFGNTTAGNFNQISAGYMKPDDPSFDRGNCPQNRSHIGNLTVGAATPDFANPALAAVASNWRVSGILTARSGGWLSAVTGRDIAGTGIQGVTGQPVDQVLEDPYSSPRTVKSYLNPAAFAYPAPGTLGNAGFGTIEGPAFWTIDVALSKNIVFTRSQNVEIRVEAFNLLNHFNWGNPTVNLDSATFGQITTTGGDMRILQFSAKYAF